VTRPCASTARLLTANFTACLLLLAQLLLGMATNLFAVIPSAHPGADARDYFTGAAAALAWVIPHGPAWVAAHAAFGLALIALAPLVIVLARRHGARADLGTAVLGALALIGAAFNGLSFLDYGHDFSSMIMTALWALAMACYLTGMLLAARSTSQQPVAPSPHPSAPCKEPAR